MAHVARNLSPIVASSAVCYMLEMSLKEIKALEAGTPSRSLLDIYEGCQQNLQRALKMYELHNKDLSLQGQLEFWNQYHDLEKGKSNLKDRINFATQVYTPAAHAGLSLERERKA